MSSVEFYYKSYKTFIYCRKEEKMINICRNYCCKLQLDINIVDFIYGGEKVNFESTFSQQIKEKDQMSNKMIIQVVQKSDIKPTNLVCPICQEIINIGIKDYKINLFGCKNGHKINNLSFKEYKEKINKIIFENFYCDNCKENSYIMSNQIFICFTCHQRLCSKCKQIHNENHYSINNGMKDYICSKHNNERFISYCENCKENLCFLCENDHENHNIIIFRKIIHLKEEYTRHLSKFKECFNIFKNNINEFIKIFNKVIEQITLYETIYEDILNDNYLINKNYIIFKNINEFYNNSIIKDIKKINKDNNIVSKFGKIMNIYNFINIDKEIKKEEKNKEIIEEKGGNKKIIIEKEKNQETIKEEKKPEVKEKAKKDETIERERNKEIIIEKEKYKDKFKIINNEKNKQDIKEKVKNDEIIKEKEKNKEDIKIIEKFDEITKDEEDKKNIEIIKEILREIIKEIENNYENNKKNEKNEEIKISSIINNSTINVNNMYINIQPNNPIRKTNSESNSFNNFLTSKINFSNDISEGNIGLNNSFKKNNIYLKRNTSGNIVRNKQFSANYLLLNNTSDISEKKKIYYLKSDSNNSELNSKLKENNFHKIIGSSNNIKKRKKKTSKRKF